MLKCGRVDVCVRAWNNAGGMARCRADGHEHGRRRWMHEWAVVEGIVRCTGSAIWRGMGEIWPDHCKQPNSHVEDWCPALA